MIFLASSYFTSIHPLFCSCQGLLIVDYMDDITLDSLATVVAYTVKFIKTEGAPKDLLLNEAKSEAITFEGKTTEPSLQQFIQLTPITSIPLGAPLVRGQAMDRCLVKRYEEMKRAMSRLSLISAHVGKRLLYVVDS